MAFAVSDQGRAAAFTALRLMRTYARRRTPRALLIAVEQADLPYDPGVPVALPAVACRGRALHLVRGRGCAAVVGDRGPSRLGRGPGRRSMGSMPRDGGARRRAGRAADDVKADLVVLADPAQPMTGVWEALANAGPDAGRSRSPTTTRALRYLLRRHLRLTGSNGPG